MSRSDTILEFWFEGIDDSTPIDTNRMPFKKWFMQDQALDGEIRRKFEPDLVKAAGGEYKDWEETAQGRLALIILFDQFPRNMYRGSGMMYMYDPLALDLTMRTIDQGKEKEFMLIHRVFLYLPLMHSEELNVQKLSLERYKNLVEETKVVNPGNTHYYEYTLRYAREHHDTVTVSGRFPSRDRILNRAVREN
jgi:uncharacterized protein (DUF924 family)